MWVSKNELSLTKKKTHILEGKILYVFLFSYVQQKMERKEEWKKFPKPRLFVTSRWFCLYEIKRGRTYGWYKNHIRVEFCYQIVVCAVFIWIFYSHEQQSNLSFASIILLSPLSLSLSLSLTLFPSWTSPHVLYMMRKNICRILLCIFW
jgi:hypothetical protein